MNFREWLHKLKKSFIFQAVLVILFIIFFAVLFVLPRYFKVREFAQKVDLLHADTQRIHNLVLSSEHSGVELQNILLKLEHYEMMIPKREELASILDKIASQAQIDGLEVLSIKPMQSNPYKNAPTNLIKNLNEVLFEVGIQMQAKGYFRELGQYAASLEKGPYHIIIRDVSLRNKNDIGTETLREPELSIEITIGILMRFSKEDAAA